ncbi:MULTISPECIES: hypothetical protein [Tenacibaculum]|uniref:Uncharacterized protein n=1 Tax=Tenacibaculum mesophilum TaxID=104268 RepID=A0AAE9SHY2_9FLAO|nr:hypothetical protein [Tenacibaculum mesophilum]KAF9658444.1 hypothetical protein HBA12_14810 [Tenacibaculum mesophilum]QFS27606.1 hypothetical protein F9Y86_04030 [Tenacibaculum mesophilum]UTD15031.1 hypothetical protein HER15_05900 [Tenacibaculum mesophilum]
MKKSILNLGTPLNKSKQQLINGSSNQPCPSINCYYGNIDTQLYGSAVYCGSCSDYTNLPSICKNRVRVGVYCSGV